MRYSFKFSLVAVVFSLAIMPFFGIPEKAQAAFGISPPFMNAGHLVKGARYSQVIYLVQDQPNDDFNIKVTADIPDKIKSWISVDKGMQFTIPKGVRQFPVEVIVQVPQDAEMGNYHGTISFTSAPNQSGQVTIALGAQMVFNLTVGNDIYEKFSVPLIRFLDIEEGWNPRVLVKFTNEGNVAEQFTGATYELLDQFGGVRLAYTQKTRDFPEVPPFTTKEFITEFPLNFHLGLGQYWAVAVFYQNDKMVASQKTIFHVLKAGSIGGTSAKLLNFLETNKIAVGGVAGVFIILILFLIYFTLRRRRT